LWTDGIYKEKENAISNDAKGIIKNATTETKRCTLVKYKKDLCWWSEQMP
jgi:hypothetical protein